MLAYNENGTWREWSSAIPLPRDGELNWVSPLAEALYGDDELKSFGLERVVESQRPDETVFNIDSTSLEMLNGVVTLVYSTTPRPITSADIAAERDRRIDLPLKVDIPGIGAFSINMDAKSRDNISGMSTLAILATLQGNTGVIISFRDYDNVDHQMTAAQVISMGTQTAARIDTVYHKSFAIKGMKPIPVDYADDKYW